MKYFEKFNKANRNFFAENAGIFLVLCAFFGVIDWK